VSAPPNNEEDGFIDVLIENIEATEFSRPIDRTLCIYACDRLARAEVEDDRKHWFDRILKILKIGEPTSVRKGNRGRREEAFSRG
jgi:hypothetical protein